MALVLAANVQRRPFRAPVKRQRALALVQVVYFEKLVEADLAGAVDVEEAKGKFILGVGFRNQVVVEAPVLEGDAARLAAVCDEKENAILVALDFVLRGCALETSSGRTRRIGAHKVLSGRRDTVDELVLAEKELARRLILDGVLVKLSSRDICEVRLLGCAEKSSSHTFLDGGGHGSKTHQTDTSGEEEWGDGKESGRDNGRRARATDVEAGEGGRDGREEKRMGSGERGWETEFGASLQL